MRPEAEEYVGKYVRALHDFQSARPGELTLSKGEILKVTSYIDKNWLKGKSGENEGNFPKDFVEKIQLPHINSNQKLFAAIENFPPQQDGDLGFCKGDIIVGLHAVDEYWWEGECNKATGIFPITHVMEIEIPILLRQRTQSVHSSETLFAQALVDAKAQLDEELSFQAGDIIKVTEVVDEDWYVGECRGKSGMFLSACVQLLNEDECIESGQPAALTDNSVSADAAQTNKATLQSDNQHTSHIQTEPHTVDKVDERSTADHGHGRSFSDTTAGVTPYAMTLYQFVGENSDELSFEANDIVTLIQHVDEQWIEGEIDGQIGLFPAAFVEIVVDCPYAYNTEQSTVVDCQYDYNTEQSAGLPADQHGDNQNIQKDSEHVTELPTNEIKSVTESSGEEIFALVLFPFVAETPQDLSVSEGETLTVIEKIDDSWIMARNEAGQEGICPRSFVDIIGEMPETTQTKCDKNDNEIKASSDQVPDIHTEASDTVVERKDNYKKMDELGGGKVENLSDVSNLSDHNPKPKLKPKPLLAPKPVLKPKPSLSPKLFTSDQGSFKSVKFDASTLPKSASSKSLATSGKSSPQSALIPKSQSMSDINRHETQTHTNQISQLNDSQSGSTSSLDSEKRNSAGKKVFEDWDLSKPLDSMIKNEFVRAEREAVSRSRSNSVRSSGSGVDVPDRAKQPVSTNNRVSYPGNYSRDNFESMTKDAFSVGNSVFFVNDLVTDDKKMRKPPVPPSAKPEFQRQSSLKRAAPPRPTGPRIAPSPSKTPLVPTPAPSNPAQVREVPTRPHSGPRRPNRPAPPRPQGLTSKESPPRPTNNNLMRFSPPEPVQSTDDFIEEDNDNETVQDLKSRIAALENDLQGFQKSKEELEQMQDSVGGEDTEIHENISFYHDNIQGLTTEIDSLKENLAEISPRERHRLDQEKAAVLQRQEAVKLREAQKKRMAEEREERKEKRMKVIDELIQTERDFLTSLSLMMDTFLNPDVEKHPQVDIKLLFGNIDEVADISQGLLTKLEDATCNKDFTEQVIGTCFITLAEDMKMVYAPYCRNHDDVITLIEKMLEKGLEGLESMVRRSSHGDMTIVVEREVKPHSSIFRTVQNIIQYNQNADIKAYLEKLLDKLREQHTVFDLEALLIKPVQRVLKYPLLLNALLKATEEDHKDRKEVMKAIGCMTDVATAINEYKRRKDLVFKYKKMDTEALGDKLSKLSLHSIRKKSSRIRGRFSANFGLGEVTRDPVFEREETLYRHLEKTVKVFVKDVQLYLVEAQEVVNIMESMAANIEDYYGEKRDLADIQKYQTFQNKVQMTFLPNFKIEVDELVLLPLNQLSQMFIGPNKVIQKRYDKLLDFDNMKRKAQSDRASEKAVQTAKQNYEALNDQLLDELPRLYKLAFQLLQDCVGSFVRAQREYQNCILQETYAFTDLQFLGNENLLETFDHQHAVIVDKLAMLAIIPRSFSPRMAELKPDKKSKRMSLDPSLLRTSDVTQQSESQRSQVIQQYAADKVFRVIETISANVPEDLSVFEGDIVGVIMDKHPMGHKEVWFVNNGAQKGFVPSRVLSPYESSQSRPVSMIDEMLEPTSVVDAPRTTLGYTQDNIDSQDGMDFALEEDMTPEVPESFDETELQLYYALYPFTARNDNEVSLFEHQVVNVLHKHDQDGNTEWWYVEADGHYGYTPATYLKEMDPFEDPT